MPRFRKKPIEIEARAFTRGQFREVTDWCRGTIVRRGGRGNPIAYLIVHTLEGDMTAAVGDWIIRGVQGEFYPCKPDIFEANYEPAN